MLWFVHLAKLSACRPLRRILVILLHLEYILALPPRKASPNEKGHIVCDIDLSFLWLQDQAVRDRLPLHNVLGSQRPADLMTKHRSSAQIATYLQLLNMEYRDGRAENAADLHDMQRHATTPLTGHTATHGTNAHRRTHKSHLPQTQTVQISMARFHRFLVVRVRLLVRLSLKSAYPA